MLDVKIEWMFFKLFYSFNCILTKQMYVARVIVALDRIKTLSKQGYWPRKFGCGLYRVYIDGA